MSNLIEELKRLMWGGPGANVESWEEHDAIINRAVEALSHSAAEPVDDEKLDNLLIRLSVALYEGGKRGDNEAGLDETEALRAYVRSLQASAGAKGSSAVNGVPATWRHDEGAIARCSYCLRYSLEPRALERETHPCDCGKTGGWSGSFQKPGPDAVYSGRQPQTQAPSQQLTSEGDFQKWLHRVKFQTIRKFAHSGGSYECEAVSVTELLTLLTGKRLVPVSVEPVAWMTPTMDGLVTAREKRLSPLKLNHYTVALGPLHTSLPQAPGTVLVRRCVLTYLVLNSKTLLEEWRATVPHGFDEEWKILLEAEAALSSPSTMSNGDGT